MGGDDCADSFGVLVLLYRRMKENLPEELLLEVAQYVLYWWGILCFSDWLLTYKVQTTIDSSESTSSRQTSRQCFNGINN